MTVMVALLRAVNVGGRNRLAMPDLRRAAEACGFHDVRTYIQSGNVVFGTTVRPATAALRLRAAIAEGTGLEVDVVVRTRDELADAVARNPYLERGEDPAHLHVVFTSEAVADPVGPIDLARYAPEEAAAGERLVYLLLPMGMGRSKLAADLGRLKVPSGTARNWRTVTTLLAMADEGRRA